MKKNILVVLTFLYLSIVAKCQTITVDDIPSSICAGSIISVPFTVAGSFNSNNIFTAQLSDPSGSFANPVNLGTLFSSTSGTINALIPQSTTFGTAYRIRVIGISPSINGSVNNTALTINPASFPSFNITANRATQSICSGQRITFSAEERNFITGSSSHIWYKNGIESGRFDTYTNADWHDGDVIKCKIIYNSACHFQVPIWSNNIIINVNNTNPDSWQQKSDVGSNQANGPSAINGAVGFSIGNKGYIGLGLVSPTCNDDYKNDFWEYDTLFNSWTQKADFPDGGRIYPVGFSIGDKGYVGTGYKKIGICSSFLYCNDFWQFDPMLNEWTQKSNFAGSGRSRAIGFSIGSKGYVGTGSTNLFSNGYLNDFWEYDPLLDTWTQKNNFPGEARESAIGFSIESKGYVGTGQGSNRTFFNDFWEYNPSTNSWLQRNNFPGPPRYEAIGFSIGSKGYAGTGVNDVLSSSPHYDDFYEFNPVSNVWTVKASFEGGSRRNAIGFNIGSRGYVGLGMIRIYTISNDFFEYNPTLNSWKKKADFGAVQERLGAIGFSIGRKGYIGLGIVAGNMGGVKEKGIWEYDQITNLWTQKASFLGLGQRFSSVAFSIGEKGYVGTGGQLGDTSYKDFWEYNPTLNSWTQKADLPGNPRQQAVGFNIGLKGFIGTGVDRTNGQIFYNDFYEYDPLVNTWIQKANFPGLARSGAVGFSIGQKGYIGTGYTGQMDCKDFWEYNPQNNLWTRKSDFAGLARSEAVGFSIGQKGYIGSGSNYSDFWEYNQALDNWTQKNNFSGEAGYKMVAFSIGDKGYLGTGFTNKFWEYTPSDFQNQKEGSIFTPIAPICRGENITLSAMSNNGFSGTWSPAINNLATTTYTFTPTSGACARDTTMTVIVSSTNAVTPTFTQISSICYDASFSLPTTSNNGITGTWSPSLDSRNTTTYTFTPNQGQCALQVTMTVIVNPNPTNNTISVLNTNCLDNSVYLTTSATSLSGIASYQWQLNNSNVSGANAVNHYTGTSGTYKVLVTDNNGCTDISSDYTLTTSLTPLSGTYTIGAVAITGASSSGNTVTVSSTAGLYVGAKISIVTTSSTGALAANSTVASITDATHFVLTATPTTPLSGASLSIATCTNYISFATAINDLNSRGVSGSCTFNIAGGYNETIITRLDLGSSILNASIDSNTISFQKLGAGSNPKINAYAGTFLPNTGADGIWSLSGVDNVTIDGIDLNDGNAIGAPLMEYGFGLFKLSASDGAQNNTIKNCIVTLNRADTLVGSGPILQGSVGIAIYNSLASAAITSLTPTEASGTNSNNKFYTNTIQNCNIGIGLNGYDATAPFTFGDTSNDIGGSSSATGNTIINFGGGSPRSSSTLASAGIWANNQWGINIQNNTINNNNGTGVNHLGIIRGIYGQAGLSANATISNNRVNITVGSTNLQCAGIENVIGNTAANNTVSINNNVVTGNYTNATGGAFYAIYNNAAVTNLNMNNNKVYNCAMPGTGVWRGIYNGNNSCVNINMNNDTLLNNNLSGSTSTALFGGIYTAALSSATKSINMSNNYIVGNNRASAAVIGTLWWLYAASASATLTTTTLNNNIIRDNTITYTASNIGEVAAIFAGTSIYTISGNIIKNNGINNTATSSAVLTMNGIRCVNSATSENIYGNKVSRLYISGSGNSTGLNVINGIYTNAASSTKNIHNNSIDSLYTKSDYSAAIYGIRNATGTTVNIYKNSIHSLYPGQSVTAGSIAAGIRIQSSGANSIVNIHNNMVALDLSTAFSPAANAVINSADGLRGIDLTTTSVNSTINAYYNSIRLGGTGSNTLFGSSAFYHTSGINTTANLNMINNILVNACTPKGAGISTALRRSSNVISNYVSTSNNNVFYAGDSSANNLLYFDGTTSARSLLSLQTALTSSNANSITTLPSFVDPTRDLHLNSSNPINAVINNAGISIANYSTDFDEESRNNSPDIGADEFTFNDTIRSTAAVLSGSASICNGNSTNLRVDITGGLTPFTIVYTNGVNNFTVNNYQSGDNISVAPTVSSQYGLISVISANGASGTGNSGVAIVNIKQPTNSTTNISNCVSYSWNGTIYSSSGIYSKLFTNAVGCDSVATLNLTVNTCATTLHVTAFLEGFYTGNGTMRATLYDLGISTDVTETDSIQVNLWSASNLSSATPDYSVTAVLHTNGTLTAVFPGATLNNSYYVALKHRNSIEIWSAEPITISSTGSYNFSTNLSSAHTNGFNDAMILLSGGKYAIYGGDVNQDGTIDLFDAQITENNAAELLFGYDASDCNGDGSSDLFDLQLIDNNNSLLIFTARP